jgi:hypothetical protein
MKIFFYTVFKNSGFFPNLFRGAGQCPSSGFHEHTHPRGGKLDGKKNITTQWFEGADTSQPRPGWASDPNHPPMGWWLVLHQPPWSFVTRENRAPPCVPGSSQVPLSPHAKSFTSNSLFPGGRREMFLTINGSPTDYLREMLVLANEMFNSPPVSPGPCLCSCASNKEETFSPASRSRIFVFSNVEVIKRRC